MSDVQEMPGTVTEPRPLYDRVGGVRLTPLGVGLLAVLLLAVAGPMTSSTARLAGPAFGVVWVAFAAVEVIGVIAPLVLARRLKVSASSPRDGVVGETIDVTVTIDGLAAEVEARVLDPTGEWMRVRPGVPSTFPHLADRRGLFPILRVEVRVTAPLGILAVNRVHELTLPWSVEIAPRTMRVDWKPTASQADGGAHPASLPSPTGDLVRSVRPYVPGDPRHLVHWPSTARTGELVVRELDAPSPVRQAVVVDLTWLGDRTEAAASYALGACLAVLAAGGQLLVATHEEAAGPVVGIVRHPVDAGRRLARAVPGVPGVPPPGWPVVEIGL